MDAVTPAAMTPAAAIERRPVGGAIGRGVYIMWLRQMKRFLRSRTRIAASLAQPLLFLLTFGFGFSAVFSEAGRGSYMQFVAPGIIGMGIVFTAVFGGMEVIWDRQFGFLKETLVAPVPRIAIMLGRTLGGATVATIQGLLVFAMTLIVGFRPLNWLLVPAAIGVMVLMAIMFTALGTMVAIRLRDMQGFQLIMNFLVMPLFFLSGALFPLTGLPEALAWVVRLDPLTYGIDALRGLLAGGAQFSYLLDFGVIIGVSALLLLGGAFLFRRIEG